jgi:UDP-N-acetylmuramoylalanine-D-glutamate ligase
MQSINNLEDLKSLSALDKVYLVVAGAEKEMSISDETTMDAQDDSLTAVYLVPSDGPEIALQIAPAGVSAAQAT